MWTLKAYIRNAKTRQETAEDATTLNRLMDELLTFQPGTTVEVWRSGGGFVGYFRGAKNADGAYTGDPGVGVGHAGFTDAVLPLPGATPAPVITPETPPENAPDDPDDWL